MNIDKVIADNAKFGIKTVVFNDDNGILGYTENGIIYLNQYYSNDIELANKHEILHLFEDSKQFEMIKKMILIIYGDDIDKLRKEYYLKYNMLYSKEQIEQGILDNEIVIDIMIGNGKFTKKLEDFIKNAYQTIIENKEEIKLTSKTRKYLNLNMSINDKRRYFLLDKWDKIFASNFYNGKSKPNGPNKENIIKEDAKKAYDNLASLSLKDFSINTDNNPIINRRLKEIIDNHKRNGNYQLAKDMESNYTYNLNLLANEISKYLYASYKNIINLLENGNYSDSFKYLILKETLDKTYRYEQGKRIVDKRNLHDDINSHMLLNEYILNELYTKVDVDLKFSDLYFDILESYQALTSKKDETSFETGELGQWIRFGGHLQKNQAFYTQVGKLATLVNNTPWCTKKDPAYWIQPGYEFYVFVDFKGKPHIAVSIDNGTLREIRGVKGESDQEIEDEYRGVAIEFLQNHNNLKNADVWYKKEMRNDRLYDYLMSIKKNILKDSELKDMVKDLNDTEDLIHIGGTNSHELELLVIIKTNKELQNRVIKLLKEDDKLYKFIEKANWNERILTYIEKIKNNSLKEIEYRDVLNDIQCVYDDVECNDNLKRLIELINTTDNDFKKNIAIESCKCDPSELFIGPIDCREIFNNTGITTIPYSYVIGSISAHDIMNFDFPNLKYISGSIDLSRSENINMPRLNIVGENLILLESDKINLESLMYVDGDINAYSSNVNMPSLESVNGSLDLDASTIDNLSSLVSIYGDLIIGSAEIKIFESLKFVKGNIAFGKYTKQECEMPLLEHFGTCENPPNNIIDSYRYDSKMECYIKVGKKRI